MKEILVKLETPGFHTRLLSDSCRRVVQSRDSRDRSKISAEMPIELGEEAIAFSCSAVSVLASMADDALVPVIARAVGRMVSDDGRLLHIYLRHAEAVDLLRSAAVGRPIAVMFSRPSTNRSMQVKGRVAAVRPADATGLEECRRYKAQMIEELGPLGFDRAFVDTLLSSDGMSIQCLAILPDAVFDQTPGPHAGQPVAS